VADQFTECDQ